MDIDRFLATGGPVWNRLADLTARGGRGVGRLSAAELDELVKLYQRTSTHLSYARTHFPDPALLARLSRLVASAGGLIYGTRPRTLRAAGRFFTTTFPAAVWNVRRLVLASAALFFLPALVVALWLANTPAAVEIAAPPSLQLYLDYYTDTESAQFFSEVFTNNVRVAIGAFALGVVFCVPTALLLAYNGMNLGVAGGLFAAEGRQEVFWGFILPHGLLELTAIVVAGAAGLRLGWSLIDPGDRPRTQALAEEGRRTIVIVVGLVLAFLVAGLIEGFVTRSQLPTWAEIAVGVLAEVAFVGWVVVQGRAAARQGLTGALGEEDRGGWAVSVASGP